MKIMTYNIYDGAVDSLDDIIAIVNAEAPDFLSLNEANEFEIHDSEKLRLFATKTNFPYYHLEQCSDGGFHVAILSKLPFEAIAPLHPLARAGVIVTIKIPIGKIALCGTHLSPHSEDRRLDEVALILKNTLPYNNKIILGDLNSLSSKDRYDQTIIHNFNSKQIRKFTTDGKVRFDAINTFTNNGFVDSAVMTGNQKICTVPTTANQDAAHSHMRLDYILVSQSLKNNITNYKVIKNKLTERASDHYPVVLEITY